HWIEDRRRRVRRLNLNGDVLRAIQMEASPMGFTRLRQRAFQRAGNPECRRRTFCRGAIRLDRFLLRRTPAAFGKLVQSVRGQAPRKTTLFPACACGRALLRRFAGKNLELVAVIRPALSREGFDPNEITASLFEFVDEISVG